MIRLEDKLIGEGKGAIALQIHEGDDVSPDVTRLMQLFGPTTPVLPSTFLGSITVELFYEILNKGSSSAFETNFVCIVSDSGSYEGSVHLSKIMTAWKGETLSKLLKHRDAVTQLASNTDVGEIV